jgi:quinol monooxygenase YgiN
MLCPFDAGCWNECCNALINGLALKQSVKRRTPMIIARLGIQAAPENKEEAMRVMLPLLGPIRAKSGCIACDFYQGMEDKMQLILVEQWESLADLERHIRSDHYRQVLSWMEMSVEPPEIHFDTVTDSGGLEIVETARGVP